MKGLYTLCRQKLLFTVLLTVLGGYCTTSTQASHLDGGNISYTHNGNSNYTIRLTLFQDCFSFSQMPFTASSQVAVVVRNLCGLNLTSVPLQRTDTIAAMLPNKCGTVLNRCNGGTLRGLRKYIWEGNVHLPSSTDSLCNEWELTWGLNEQDGFCCHATNNTLSSVANGAGVGQVSFFLRSYLNNNFSAGNSTGQLDLLSTPFFCVQYPVWMNPEQGEPDGDSLHYALVPALTAYETPAFYQNNRTATHPLPTANGVQLDALTGDIRFQPTQASTGNFVLRRSEFRSGVLIGTTDLVFKVLIGTGAYCNYPEDTLLVLACDFFVLPNGSAVFASGLYEGLVGSLSNCDTLRNFNVQLLQTPARDSVAGDRLVRPFSTHTYAVVQPDASFQYRFEVTGANNFTLAPYQANVIWGEAGVGEVQVFKYADSSCGLQMVFPIDINTAAHVADESLAGLRIFPNPAKTWVRLEGVHQVAWVRLFDLKGALLMEVKPEGDVLQLELQTLPPGMYTVAVHGQSSVHYEKVILMP
jgi:hypothetical protein